MKPVLKLVGKEPSNDEIARYYFEVSEIPEMLKCNASVVRELLATRDFGQVTLNGKLYLPPDLSELRTALWGDE